MKQIRSFHLHLLRIAVIIISFWIAVTIFYPIPVIVTAILTIIPVIYVTALFIRNIDWNKLSDRKYSFYTTRIKITSIALISWLGLILFVNIIQWQITYILQTISVVLFALAVTFGVYYRKVRAEQEEKMFVYIELFEERFGNSSVEEFYAGNKIVYGPSSFDWVWRYRAEEFDAPTIFLLSKYISWFKAEMNRSINDNLEAWRTNLPKTTTLDKDTEYMLQDELRTLTGIHWVLDFNYQRHEVKANIGVPLAKQGTIEAIYPREWNHSENIFNFPLLRLEDVEGFVFWNPTKIPHLKVIGSTGFGKTIALKALLYHALTINLHCLIANRPPFFKINIFDIVKGGGDFIQLKNMYGVNFIGGRTSPEYLESVLKNLNEIEDRRFTKQKLYNSCLEKGMSPEDAQSEIYNQFGMEITIIDEWSGTVALGKDKILNDFKKGILNVVTLISATGRQAGTHLILASQEVSAATMPSWLKTNIPISLVGWLSVPNSITVLGDTSATELPVTDVVDPNSIAVHGAGLYGQPGQMRRSQTLYIPNDMILDLQNRFNEHLQVKDNEILIPKDEVYIPKFETKSISDREGYLIPKWKM